MQFDRYLHGFVALNDDLLFVTGTHSAIDQSYRTECYDVVKNKWTEKKKMNLGRFGHSMVVFEQRYIYVIGGRTSSMNMFTSVIESYDASSVLSSWVLVNAEKKV
jgi:N-acetylneuraminic acid mutarotase